MLWPVLSRENHALPDCSVMAGRAGYHTVGKIKKLQSEHKGNCSIFLVHRNLFPNSLLYRSIWQCFWEVWPERGWDHLNRGVQDPVWGVRGQPHPGGHRRRQEDHRWWWRGEGENRIIIDILKMFSSQIHKDAFIRHLKQCNLLKDFQVADPESESYWKNRADLAFKYDFNFNTLLTSSWDLQNLWQGWRWIR